MRRISSADDAKQPNSHFVHFGGTLIVCGGFGQITAEMWLTEGKADLIAFGRKLIDNPDLPKRFREFWFSVLIEACDSGMHNEGSVSHDAQFPNFGI